MAVYMIPIHVAKGADLYVVLVVIIDKGTGDHGLRDADRGHDVSHLAA